MAYADRLVRGSSLWRALHYVDNTHPSEYTDAGLGQYRYELQEFLDGPESDAVKKLELRNTHGVTDSLARLRGRLDRVDNLAILRDALLPGGGPDNALQMGDRLRSIHLASLDDTPEFVFSRPSIETWQHSVWRQVDHHHKVVFTPSVAYCDMKLYVAATTFMTAEGHLVERAVPHVAYWWASGWMLLEPSFRVESVPDERVFAELRGEWIVQSFPGTEIWHETTAQEIRDKLVQSAIDKAEAARRRQLEDDELFEEDVLEYPIAVNEF